MNKKKSVSKSAFFYFRALTALTLCCAGVLLATVAFKSATRQNVGEQMLNAPNGEEPERYMPVPGGKRGSEASELARLEQAWSDRMTYPTGKFNPAWVRAAAEHHKMMPAGLPAGSFDRLYNPQKLTTLKGMAAPIPSSLSTSAFTSLGPSPLRMTGCSGCYDYTKTQARVNAIAIDPTTTTNGSIVAYIGSVSGGVWKSTNCCSTSSTWTLLTDDPLINTTAIDTVTIDPSNHNTIYAGTGDLNFGSFSMGSQGIMKSTDGGATWKVLGANVFGAAYSEPVGNYPQYQAVGKVRVDPNNSNNVAAGTKTGVYLSHDGGNTWTQCPANAFSTQRQDITGLELSNLGGGVTRIVAAIGTRGFPTFIQYDLGQNGANGIYSATMTNSGCPTFSSIASNANGFVYGTAVANSPYTTGANMNAGSGTPCNYPISGGNSTYCGNGPAGGATTNGGAVNNLSRIDIAVAPSNPNVIYAQAASINFNAGGCGGANGCQLGVWVTTNGGTSWSFMQGSAGPSLPACGMGDYNQNWYDQGLAVDPNNPDRVFIDTFDTWFATRTGTSFFDLTCGYNGTGAANHVVHVDHHALAFVPGSSDILLEGSDGGIFASTNASTSTGSVRPTWINMDGNLNTLEFYAGDISGNFANDPAPAAVGGAQDNGPGSVQFVGSPTGPVQWQMGLGGDGFSGLVQTLQSQAAGAITLVAGGAAAGQQFIIGGQTFTFQVAARSGVGQVTLNSSTTTEGNNIVTAVNADLAGTVSSARSGAVVTVTAVSPGAAGNAIPFSNINSANFSMNGSGTLGGTTQGGQAGNIFWEGNNSGGFSRCIANCTAGGATAVWTSRQGAWTGDTQNFALPVNIFHGGIPGGDDCSPSGASAGCGHLLAATTRVFETITGATAVNSWYITNNPSTQNMTKGTLGNRSYINQVKYSPKFMSSAIVGTNDGNVHIGFNLGTGVASQGTWVNVTGGNAVLPNRPIQGITLDPSVSAANVPVGYAAVGGFNANSLVNPAIPGHVFQVTCTATCGSFTWLDKSGNLPDVPANAVIVNPNYPQQVFVGTDFGLYYTNNITVASPIWFRFESGLPHVMIWDMQIDRGSTTLSVWTRGRGAFVYPLPSSDISQTGPTLMSAVSRMTHGSAGTFDQPLPLDGSGIEPRTDGTGNYTVIMTFDKPPTSANVTSSSGSVSNVTYSGNTATVSLSGITDQQVVTVNANNVTGTNNASQNASINVGFLIGDVNSDRTVNVGDTIPTRSHAGQTLDNTNFQYDVNVDGFVNVGDTIVVRSKSGDFLP
jgi:hypothetical protein